MVKTYACRNVTNIFVYGVCSTLGPRERLLKEQRQVKTSVELCCNIRRSMKENCIQKDL
jgi:hypothetical protein